MGKFDRDNNVEQNTEPYQCSNPIKYVQHMAMESELFQFPLISSHGC